MNAPSGNGQEHQPGRLQSLHKRIFGRIRAIAPFASGVLAALAALLLYNALIPSPTQLTARDVDEAVAQALASATPPPSYSSQVYQVIQPSLVLIQTRTQAGNGDRSSGLGSGVIINEFGDILTSLHVVDGAHEIQLTFADGTQTSAQISAAQPENDIAVLTPAELPSLFLPAILGSAGAMRVGDEAFAVGNPFGLYGSISAGVISGVNRSFQPPEGEHRLEGLLQIDAAVNPGNSGGPLLNRYGQVVGIVVGIVNPTEQDVFVGIGLAVPIQVAAGAAGMPMH
jgi:S1-C subfamily serine protease